MTEFLTPCGTITVRDESGNPVEFTVRRSEPLFPEQYLFYGTDYAYPVQTPDEYEICISAESLQPETAYHLKLHDCECRFGGSDENTYCNYSFKNNYHISIGAYNPNDGRFEETEFRKYKILPFSDWSGYRFFLLEDYPDEIIFRIAWIAHFIERPALLRFVEEEDLIAEFESYITCLTT